MCGDWCRPTFYKIYKSKSVEEFKPDPYIATVMNCMFWVFYGTVHPDSTLIITINGVGLAIELFYLAIFCWYAESKSRVRNNDPKSKLNYTYSHVSLPTNQNLLNI